MDHIFITLRYISGSTYVTILNKAVKNFTAEKTNAATSLEGEPEQRWIMPSMILLNFFFLFSFFPKRKQGIMSGEIRES